MQLAQDKVDALDRMIELLEQSERRRVRIELLGRNSRLHCRGVPERDQGLIRKAPWGLTTQSALQHNLETGD